MSAHRPLHITLLSKAHLQSGRVSEMMGEAAVTLDTFSRTLGWRRRAIKEWELLNASEDQNSMAAVAMLKAYCDGVNEYIQQAIAAGGKGNMLNGGPLTMFFMLLGIDPVRCTCFCVAPAAPTFSLCRLISAPGAVAARGHARYSTCTVLPDESRWTTPGDPAAAGKHYRRERRTALVSDKPRPCDRRGVAPHAPQ